MTRRFGIRRTWAGPILALLLVAGTATAQSDAGPTLETISAQFRALGDRVSASVVQIFAEGYGAGASGGSPTDLLSLHESTGSGVLLSEDGLIVTNAHVVGGARRVRVLLPSVTQDADQRKSILKGPGTLVGAQIVGMDQETDLAVLRIKNPGLPHLELADSDELRQGQIVFAVGSPMGLTNSISMGVVSATARQIAPDHPMVYLQTDATINPGNSGGPLVDTQGRVVGINTFIVTQTGGSQGLGFAAPSNIVRNVYDQIRQQGKVRRGEIGVYAQTITPLLGRGMGIDRFYGVILGDVYPNGPGERAGLRSGDIVLTMNGKPMENGRQFDVNLYGKPIGRKVKLEILRAGRKQEIEVEVIERAEDPLALASLVSPEQNLVEKLGILGIDLTDDLKRVLPPLRRSSGVLVAGRVPSGPYMDEGFQPGDVIHQLNGQEIHNLDQLRRALVPATFGTALSVRVERAQRMMYLAVEVR